MTMMFFLLLPLAHADEDAAPVPAPPARRSYEPIAITAAPPVPEVQIFIAREALPGLSTEELLVRVDAELRAMEEQRD